MITGYMSRFKDAINNLWIDNVVPPEYEFKLQGDSCFDPDSDMDVPDDYVDGVDYSYVFDFDESFFCGM